MANRRMFSLDIIDTDTFLDMPATARLLYYDLGMRADDDGFLQNAQRIVRMTDAGKDDLALLMEKGYLIPFESGACVIRHWCVNNQIRKDRYRPSICTEERALLGVSDSGEYVLADTLSPDGELPSGCRLVANPATQYRLGKDRLDKNRIGKRSLEKDSVSEECAHNDDESLDAEETLQRFSPPTAEDVRAYCAEMGIDIDAEKFVSYYSATGWKRGNTMISDWKSCVHLWSLRQKNERTASGGESYFDQFERF